jgi:hypothetical protein
MGPPDERAGPAPTGPTPTPEPNNSTVPEQLHARREASRRLPAFRNCGHRDPLAHRVAPDGPSTFGLTADELRKHANQLVGEHGWSPAEVRQMLDLTAVAR